MTKEKEKDKNKPLQKFRSGAVTATIWKRKVSLGKDKGSFVSYNTDLSKNYKDDEGEWQKTSSFNPQDLGDLILAANLAQHFIVGCRQNDYEASKEDEDEDEDEEE